MRFSAILSMGLSLAAVASAAQYSVAELHARALELSENALFAREEALYAREASLYAREAEHAMKRRDLEEEDEEAYDEEEEDEYDEEEEHVLQARGKSSKIKVDFSKTLQKGSIAQNEREFAKELAQKALSQAGASSGEIVYGWHDENTEDPVNHFTVVPVGGHAKGKIHVHKDGSWTQGTGGKAAHGDGKVKK